MVLCGYKYHRLVLGPNDITQQVEQHSGLGVLSYKEEGGLRGEGRTWAPGYGLAAPTWPLAAGRGPTLPHLELLIELGVHIQTDEHRLCETCWGVGETAGVTEGRVPAPPPHPTPGVQHHTPLAHLPGQIPPAVWATWPRTALSGGPQEGGL